MCTAATYKTKDFYMGRTLDYEFAYGEEVTVMPRNYPLHFRYMGDMSEHFAIIGMAHVADNYPLYYDAVNEKGLEEHSFTEQMDEKESAEFEKLENDFANKYEID